MQLPPYGPVLASRPREQFSGADPTERQEVSPHCPRPRSGHAGRHRKHCEHQHTQHGRAAGAHALHSGACVLAAGADSEKMSLISAEVAIPRRLSAGAGPSQAPTRGFTRRAAPAGVCGPEADPHLVLGLVAALLPLPVQSPPFRVRERQGPPLFTTAVQIAGADCRGCKALVSSYNFGCAQNMLVFPPKFELYCSLLCTETGVLLSRLAQGLSGQGLDLIKNCDLRRPGWGGRLGRLN